MKKYFQHPLILVLRTASLTAEKSREKKNTVYIICIVGIHVCSRPESSMPPVYSARDAAVKYTQACAKIFLIIEIAFKLRCSFIAVI